MKIIMKTKDTRIYRIQLEKLWQNTFQFLMKMCIIKKEKTKINGLIFYTQKIEKEPQSNPKESWEQKKQHESALRSQKKAT